MADSPQSGGGDSAGSTGEANLVGVDSPPLQEGAGEVGTSEGPPESRKRKREETDSDSGGESGDDGGFPWDL
jgi:hypothetical protein